VKGSKRIIGVIFVAALVVMVALLLPKGQTDQGVPTNSVVPSMSISANSDAQLRQLFLEQTSDVQVSGTGTVTRLLADDTEGSRHQRFILRLASGQTLLMVHNIDIAPRLSGLAVGDTVSFYGEYIYSDQGGTVHWTHHDPSGQHVAGWLEWRGRRYQ